MKTTPSDRIGPLTDFDTGPPKVGGKRYANPPKVPSKVELRNKETGAVTSHYTVDSREIIRQPGTLYERVAADDTPAEAA
jgi:hypothetical protein